MVFEENKENKKKRESQIKHNFKLEISVWYKQFLKSMDKSENIDIKFWVIWLRFLSKIKTVLHFSQ